MEKQEYERMHALESQYWWFVGRRAIIERLLQRPHRLTALSGISPLDGLDLLDIGCGTGANLPMLRRFAGPAGRVTGIDFSPLALRFACDHPGLSSARLLQGDAMRLPFRDASFDVVTMFDVLEHIPDHCLALQEVLRVLRPGGRYIFSVPAYQHLWSAHDTALHHFRRYEYRDLRALLRSSGYRVALLSFAMSLMPPIAWAWRRFVLPFKARRPQNAQRHSEGAILPPAPGPLNAALVKYLECEGRIIARRRLNFGTSLVGIAVKP